MSAAEEGSDQMSSQTAEICGGLRVIFPGSGGLISYGLPSLDQLKKPHSMFDKVVVRTCRVCRKHVANMSGMQ